jgi:hypothetical protein
MKALDSHKQTLPIIPLSGIDGQAFSLAALILDFRF